MNSAAQNQDGQAGPLTREQIDGFRKDGFVVVPGLYDADEVAQFSIWADEVHGWPEIPGKYMMYFEESRDDPGRRLLNRIEDVPPYHDGFAALTTGPKMLGACAQLFGEPAVLFKDKINFKLPGGGGFEPHQDVQAGWSRYADLHVTSLVTLDRTTVENGCLQMGLGFTSQDRVGSEWTPLTAENLTGVEFVSIESEPGDAVFFDSFIPHQSAPNRSDAPRRVLYYTYNKASEGDHLAQYYADKRASYPPDIERDEGKEYHYRV
jgi:hypothetical protein